MTAQVAYLQWLLSGAAPSQTGLKGEAKAFDDGVNKIRNQFGVLEVKLSKEIQAKDFAKMQSVYDEIVQASKPIFESARQLKAPPGPEGQAYYAAFNQYIDLQQRSVDQDLKQLIDGLKAPSAALLTQMARMQQQEREVAERLIAARTAFLNTGEAATAKN